MCSLAMWATFVSAVIAYAAFDRSVGHAVVQNISHSVEQLSIHCLYRTVGFNIYARFVFLLCELGPMVPQAAVGHVCPLVRFVGALQVMQS